MRANQGFWGGSKFENNFPQRGASKLSQSSDINSLIGLFDFDEDEQLELKKRETVLDYFDDEYTALMDSDEDDDEWDDEDWDDEDDDWDDDDDDEYWDDEDDDWDDDDEYWDDEDDDWDDEDED